MGKGFRVFKYVQSVVIFHGELAEDGEGEGHG